MINGLLWLLGCQLVGELVVRALDLPVPGPVVGMVVLFGVLLVRRPTRESESGTLRAADGLLRHLQLLFVPAGVGIMAHVGAIRAEWLPIGLALVLSWVAGLATVAGLVVLLVRRRRDGTAEQSAA